jgi:hypothetical protein
MFKAVMLTLHVQMLRRLIRAYSFSLEQVVSSTLLSAFFDVPFQAAGEDLQGYTCLFVGCKTANHRQGRD